MLILPDYIQLDDALAARLNDYIAGGGKVLLTGNSGLNRERSGFMLDVGAEYAGENPFCPDYLLPRFDTVNGETAYVMYSPGIALKNVTGSVFADRQEPYFNRTYAHFSSHQHTPNNADAALQPAAVQKGNVAYIGWNVFEDYAVKGELIVKELVLHAIDRLMGDDRTVRTDLPDRGVITVTQQDARSIVHLLFAHTTLRGKDIEVIEDAVPLHDVHVSLRMDHRPAKVMLVPDGSAVPFEWDGSRVSFTVPKVVLHQMVCLED